MDKKGKSLWVLFFAGAMVLWVVGFPGWADMYGYQDKEGYLHLPGVTPPRGSPIRDQSSATKGREYIQAYQAIIREASRRFGVEASLIKAVIMVESKSFRGAVSRKGAMGLMQLMPRTVKEMKVDNPFNPGENIFGGVKYLRQLLERFDGNMALAVAAYNAGPEKVEAAGGVPPIAETRSFVRLVMEQYRFFKSAELP